MDDDITIDFSRVKKFAKRHYIIFLLLIPLFLSVIVRVSTFSLPMTEELIRDTYELNATLKQSIFDTISSHLPPAERQAAFERKLKEFEEENKGEIRKAQQVHADLIRDEFQDDEGQTYLYGVDPWLWYGYARNKIQYGHWGDTYNNETSWVSYRRGRFGREPDFAFYSMFIVAIYYIANLFMDISIHTAAFITPVVLFCAGVIPGFFIAYRIAGPIAGLLSASFLAINPALVARTMAGFSDTDPFNTIFPLYTIWFLIEAFYAKTLKRKTFFTCLSMFMIGAYRVAWSGGIFFIVFIFGALVLIALYNILKEGWKYYFKHKTAKHDAIYLGVGFLAWGFFGTLFALWAFHDIKRALIATFYTPLTVPSHFIQLKSVGVASLWPNVLTTVVELQPGSISDVIVSIGGKLMFLMGIVGILFIIFSKRKEEGYRPAAILLGLWFFATLYASYSNVRFDALLSTAFSIAIAYGLISLYDLAKGMVGKKIKKIYLLIIFIIVCSLLLLGSFNQAMDVSGQTFPVIVDTWVDSLEAIKEDPEPAIVTTWWDFGHWITALSGKSVTFDGGDQGRRIYWVGRYLAVPDEDEGMARLRMLNCGQTFPYDMLEEHYEGDTIKAIGTINRLLNLDASQAEVILEEEGMSSDKIEQFIEYMYCEPMNQYVIVSNDLFGKANVWSHFGNWNFTKAKIYTGVKKLELQDGIDYIQQEFNFTREESKKLYTGVQTTSASEWIGPRTFYHQGFSRCTEIADLIICENGLIVNTSSMSAVLIKNNIPKRPYSFLYADEEKVNAVYYENDTSDLSVALVPYKGKTYFSVVGEPNTVDSLFTRLYLYKGHGLSHYELYSYGFSSLKHEVYVYKVDWTGNSPIRIEIPGNKKFSVKKKNKTLLFLT